ncbi:hypothetical protein BASA83_011901 [Batrachochytrium salamandrivorans]|nr:hypothetical protein BASA83_011901 [Batrachochytrium salamandrivorans]
MSSQNSASNSQIGEMRSLIRRLWMQQKPLSFRSQQALNMQISSKSHLNTDFPIKVHKSHAGYAMNQEYFCFPH